MRTSALAPLMALSIFAAAGPAAAALIVSGDSQVLHQVEAIDGNRQFLLNLAGSGIVVLHPGEFTNFITVGVSQVLGDAAVPYIPLSFDAPVSAADLLGASLYVSYLDATGWTAAEAQLLTTFVTGGGHVLLSGDNSFFAAQNAAINALTAAMGSNLFIVGDNISPDIGGTASILADNALTAGTVGLRYASTSRVTGGTPLYATETGVAFIAFDPLTGGAAVPEPDVWTMMIIGFGAAGAMIRQRRRLSAPVGGLLMRGVHTGRHAGDAYPGA